MDLDAILTPESENLAFNLVAADFFDIVSGEDIVFGSDDLLSFLPLPGDRELES